tara:strand:- start:1317 stop:1637 length:321 start_codon:yes stop_codon:yes gene_type:complete
VFIRLLRHITAAEQDATKGSFVGQLAGQLKDIIEGIFVEGLVPVETNSAEFSILLDWWKERVVGAVTDDLVDLTALVGAAASEGRLICWQRTRVRHKNPTVRDLQN